MQNGNWVDGHSDNKINGTDNWSTTCASDMCLYLLDHPELGSQFYDGCAQAVEMDRG